MVVVVGVGSFGFAALSTQPRPDCRTAAAAVQLVHDRSDLLDLKNIVVGGPDLAAYRNWADQLSRLAGQVSAGDIAPHLRAIADRALDGVSLCRSGTQRATTAAYRGTAARLWAGHVATPE